MIGQEGSSQEGGGWRRRLVRWPLVLLAAVFLLQWAAFMHVGGPSWDAAFYYSFGRSLAFDQDLKLENDLLLSYETASPDFVAKAMHADKTSTGRVATPFALGSGLLWLPLLAVVRLFAWLVGAAGGTGYEWYFAGTVASFSALSGLVAYGLAYRIARRETGRVVAALATVTVAFATPLLYYQFREPLYAHVSSALTITLCVYVWQRTYDRLPPVREGVLFGVLLGLAALVRWQNVIYALLPLSSVIWVWVRRPAEERRKEWMRPVAYLAGVAGSSLIVFSIQLVFWRLVFGVWATIPQGETFMVWTDPFVRELLLSPFRGLLPWMPVFAPAVLGLLLQMRRRPRVVLPLLLILLLSTYVNASSRDWFAGGGYGPRRLTGELAIFVLGYAWLLQALPTAVRTAGGIVVGLLLALHQLLLLRFGLVERLGGSVVSMAPRFEWRETDLLTFGRQLLGHIPDVVRRPVDFFVLPGSPLSVWLQEGVFPLQHVLALAGAGLFLGLFLWLASRAPRKGKRIVAPAAALAAVLLLDIWLLLRG
ncbi:MAG: hypothetical protein R3248_05985 [Candidatus Promineifilaceae bacterium]|nr:hypothetical protein [Candidatus Promineifilaceae bacterium]